jgi:hypothetical protein
MSPLPVTPEYLMSALEDGHAMGEMTLHHHKVSELILPTGQLVACDPFMAPDIPPFKLSVPSGKFPVVLSIAHIKTDQRVAFATLRLMQTAPVSWEMLTIADQNLSTLEQGELFGYGVDSGTGCFMDLSTRRALAARMDEQQDFYETLTAEMDKTYKHTWSWLDTKLGEGNLVAFSSGYGDGVYATYAGRDSDGQVSVVVTDFGVLPFEKPSQKPTRKTLSSFVIGLFRKN